MVVTGDRHAGPDARYQPVPTLARDIPDRHVARRRKDWHAVVAVSHTAVLDQDILALHVESIRVGRLPVATPTGGHVHVGDDGAQQAPPRKRPKRA